MNSKKTSVPDISSAALLQMTGTELASDEVQDALVAEAQDDSVWIATPESVAARAAQEKWHQENFEDVTISMPKNLIGAIKLVADREQMDHVALMLVYLRDGLVKYAKDYRESREAKSEGDKGDQGNQEKST